MDDQKVYEIIYALLGIDKDSTLKEIKESYRRRAKELHPDLVNIDPSLFIALSKSYEFITENFHKDPTEHESEITNKDLAKSKIQNFFNDFLQSQFDERIFKSDLIGNIKVVFKTDTKKIQQEIRRIQDKEKLFKKLQQTISCDQEDNFLQRIISQYIISFSKTIKDLENRIEINNLALELLDNFKFSINL